MRSKSHALSLLIVLLLAALGPGCRAAMVTSGPAPDFILTDTNGDTVLLSDMAGHVVVLDFWASWCDPCVDALGHLQRLHEQYADQGVIVLAINIGETHDEVTAFMADREYTFTVLLDTEGRVTDSYGVQAIPHTVIVDRGGEVYAIPLGLGDAEEILSDLVAD